MEKINQKILKEIYQKRPANSKKYDFGLLTVIGGSEFYSGSPALAALAAFRTGVDMVHIIAPKRAADVIASFSPNLAAYPLKSDYLTREHLPLLLEMVKGAEKVAHGKAAVVIGGGMGRSQETQETICDFLSQIDIPAVIDADGLHAVAKKPEVIKGKPFLVTPHTYEFFILTGRKVQGLSQEEKIQAVKEEAVKLETTILLKGNPDIIAYGEKMAISFAGSPYMTVGGTGDTLAGIAGALMARGVSSFKTGCAAAFINGLAGGRAAKKLGESVTATNLVEEISGVLPR